MREEKKGEEENSFHGNVCAYLTCRLLGDLLMGDPKTAVTPRPPHKTPRNDVNQR